MIADLHAHTRFSLDSDTEPRLLASAALAAGIGTLAFTDHWHFYCDKKEEYLAAIKAVQDEFAGRIRILCGAEIATVAPRRRFIPASLDGFDLVLVEHVGYPDGFSPSELIEFKRRTAGDTPVIMAHTDAFALARLLGIEPEKFLSDLAAAKIVWELNVNLDNIHGGKPHEYVGRFFFDESEQQTVKNSGISVSVGFDSHILSDYKPYRVTEACERLEKLKIPLFTG